MASGTSPLCTTGIEYGLRSPTLVNLTKFAGTGKNLAKILVGMLSLCNLDVVHVWYCLIISLVVMIACVTHMLVANESYIAFHHSYISFCHLYIVFNHSYVSQPCSYIVHILHPSSVIQSLMRDSSMCNMVCCHYDNPTNAPICNTSMARLPWGLQKHAILAFFVVLALMHHMIFSLLW